jgi:transposase
MVLAKTQDRNSPDFNPIELNWAKLKSVLRKIKPRTFEEIEFAMKTALEIFIKSDLLNWFVHDRYVVNL